MRRIAMIGAGLALLLSSGAAWSQEAGALWGPIGEVTPVQDPENVVGSELLGEWVLDTGLTARLNPSGEAPFFRVVFEESFEAGPRLQGILSGVAAKIDEDTTSEKLITIGEALRAVYRSGEIATSASADGDPAVGDFLLVTLRGNPHIIVSDRAGDLESFNIMLARDHDGDNDILFIGGDFNNTSFNAYVRAQTVVDPAFQDDGAEK